MNHLPIPPDFEMGVATSSWQIEGDVAGRGRCNWDDFAETPGNIIDGATGEPACDHVHRLDEDLGLINWLNVDAYRFSMSWPRIIPDGVGPVSKRGLDFYDRLVDGLLEREVLPVATMFHWDLPSALEDAGGWVNRDTASAFADYAAVITEHFADRVDRWATLNEPWCPAFLGYAAGYFAPGRTEPGAALAAAYHLMLAHGLAVQRARAAGARNVGIVLNLTPVYPESPAAQAAAEQIDGIQNRFFLDLLAGRGIPADVRARCADLTDWSFVRPEDAEVIASPIDWLGENYYSVVRVAEPGDPEDMAIGQDAAAFPGIAPVRFVPRDPRTDMGWEIFPQGMIDVLRMASAALPGVPLWVCENGAATAEVIDGSGVHDPDRIAYVDSHIRAVLQARAEGIDVRGYFLWSLLDNLEWATGWTKKFGIIRVDPVTGERTKKDSAIWFQQQLAGRSRSAPTA